MSLNEVSTIVAAYSDAHPEMTYEDVTDVAAIYLGVPYYVSLEEVVKTCDVYGGIFSPELFSVAAKEEFGEFDLDSFINIIVTEIDEDKQHLFAAVDDYENFLPPGVELWEDDGLVSTQSAAAVGKVLEVVFGFLEFAGQIADAIFTEIYQNFVTTSLTQIMTQLNEVQGQLVDIQTQLAKLTYLNIQGQYDTRMTTVNSYLTSIKNNMTELRKFAKLIPFTDPTKLKEMQGRVREIRSAILSPQTGQGYANILANLSNAVANSDGTTTLMKLRSMVMQRKLGTGDSATMDDSYLPFFQNLILQQLQGWVLYTHAYKDAYGDVPTAKDAYYQWRKENLKWQVDSFVQGAEDYALNHMNGDFYKQTFPCNDAFGTFLSNVDTFAETVYPTFPKENASGYISGATDGVFFVRLVFPVFPPPSSGNYLDPNNQKYIVKLHQNQDPSWMGKPNQGFFNKADASDTHNLDHYLSHYTSRNIEGKIGFSSNTPKVDFYEPVKWVLGTFRIPTSSLKGSTYAFNNKSQCLEKCAPQSYQGGDTEANLRVSKDLTFKYGWWHLQMAPSLETAIDTWHQRPDRVSHIWVNWGTQANYMVYTALEPNQFEQRTDNLKA